MFQDMMENYWQEMSQLSRNDILDKIEEQDPEMIKQIHRVEYVFRHKLKHLTWDDGSPVMGRDYTNYELARILDPPFQPLDMLTERGFDEQQQFTLFVSQDQVLWAKYILGVEPRVYQVFMLRDIATRTCYRLGRRMGKSFVLAIKILYHGWTTTNGGILVLAPMSAHVDVLYDTVLELAQQSDLVSKSIKNTRQTPYAVVNFTTGSSAKFFTTGMKSGGKCLTQDHEVLTADGWQSIMNVEKDQQVLSWDGSNYVWKPVTNTHDEFYADKMIKVNNPSLSIFATANHRLPVWRDGKWQMICMKDAEETDEIPISGSAELQDPEFADVLLYYLEADHIPQHEFSLTVRSRRAADNIQKCAILLGRHAQLTPSMDGWVVNISATDTETIPIGKLKESYFTGPVFCIEVADTHTFVARHNGKVFISGNSDVARGQEAEVIILDEMDYMSGDDLDAIYAILMPTKEGEPDKTLIASSTPSGKHGMFKEWATNPRYGFSSHWYPAYANIVLDKEAEEDQRAGYKDPNSYRREIEADWGEPAEGVYPKRHLDRAFVKDAWNYVPRRQHDESTYYIGVDWDKSTAGPNIVVLEVLPENHEDPRFAGMLRVIFREEIDRHQDYPIMAAQQRIIDLNNKFQPARIMLDRGYGDCVDPETLITTQNGLVPMKDIQPGASVITQDEKWHEVLDKIIRFEEKRTYKVDIANGSSVIVSDVHPFLCLTDAGPVWMDIEDMHMGDKVAVLNHTGQYSYEPIIGMQYMGPKSGLMDISVDQGESFVGNGVLLHNTQAEYLQHYGIDNPRTQLKQRLTPVSFSENVEIKNPVTRETEKKKIKPYMISILQSLLEAEQIFFPAEDDELYHQLMGYVVLRVSDDGRPVYEGIYSDHAHDALVLACLGYAYDHDRLHAKPNVAKQAAIARNMDSRRDDDDYPRPESRVGAIQPDSSRRSKRVGAGRLTRKKF